MRTVKINYNFEKMISSFETFLMFKEYFLTHVSKEELINISSVYEINTYGENEKRINFKTWYENNK
jgi:hypothetical protein